MRRRSAALIAAVLLAAGCSGAEDRGADAAVPPPTTAPSPTPSPTPTGDPQDEVRAAVARTVRTSARVATRHELRSGGRIFTLTVTGDFDLGRDRGRLAVDFPGGAIDHLDEVFAGDRIYVRGFSGRAGEWGSIPRRDARAHYLLRAPLNDPEHVLQQLARARLYQAVGERDVNGSPATLYHGSLDFRALTYRMAGGTRSDLGRLRRAARDGDLGVRVLAWVDRQGRVVRTEVAFRQGGVEATSITTLSDFGKPVKVIAPRAGSVTPIGTYSGILPG